MGAFPAICEITTPFLPGTSVTMATVSAMTSRSFLGNSSQCSDIMQSPWRCSMRPGRKYLKWEERSGRTPGLRKEQGIKDKGSKKLVCEKRKGKGQEQRMKTGDRKKYRGNKKNVRNLNYYLIGKKLNALSNLILHYLG